MGAAKGIRVEPIAARDAARVIRSLHYSGAIVNNSQLHLGVFLDGKCGGALQLGPSTYKQGMIGLVRGTPWNGFLELNRMAFADWLPRNSESRALAVAMRLIRKHYPHVQWIVTFADGTRCGDGTIYRAAGFRLIGAKRNRSMLELPDGRVVSTATLWSEPIKHENWWLQRGAKYLDGYMLKYVFLLDPTAEARLTVPILPFSELDRLGARMYRGKRVGGVAGGTPGPTGRRRFETDPDA